MSGAVNALGTTSNPFATQPAQGGDPNEVSITVGSQKLSGWQEVRIRRGIENCPSSFDISLTELYPTTPTKIAISPGDPCKVAIGSDTIITGYVDRYVGEIGPDRHTVSITGRSKMQDLVDCSAKFATYQASSITLFALAKKLAAPFGVSVTCPDGDSEAIPILRVTLTETPFEVLEHVARWAQRLLYDDTDGNLVIATLGDTKMASGFSEGQNIQAAFVSYSTDGRYTEIDPIYVATEFLLDPPPPVGSTLPVIPYIPDSSAVDKSFPARADGQQRFRPLLVVSSQTQNSAALAKQYAAWEMARRYGRSQVAKITCDNWRDSAGKLWQPNSIAVVNVPSLKLENKSWLISEVSYVRGPTTGTTAEVTLMPQEAFAPQRELLLPYDWQVGDQPNTGASTTPSPRK